VSTPEVTARPPYAEAARTLLRDSILDAAGELLADAPWERVTMAAIAERAGVSRQTLYNEFGSRRELAQAYLIRESDAFLEPVEEAIAANAADPGEALAAAFEVFLSLAAGHPIVRAISSPDDGDELLAMVTTRGGPLLANVNDRLGKALRDTWPQLPARDARIVSDAMVRLAISHAALPDRSPRQTAADIASLLRPYAEAALAK
jgi:AcrR family transcriptional regulator